jgi:HSP20 family protein
MNAHEGEELEMSSLIRRGRGTSESPSQFNRMDRLFDEWMRLLPARRPFGFDWPGDDLIRVDEFREGDVEVIRAELPGIDPEKDIDITVADGMLRINAERRIEEKAEERGYSRHELRYGRMSRTLPLPDGVSESDITATYRDGILEIRVPVPERPESAPKKIAISTG